jgi:hypothetical protein
MIVSRSPPVAPSIAADSSEKVCDVSVDDEFIEAVSFGEDVGEIEGFV